MSVSAYLAGELESHACAVCYERMEAPERPPMLLIPCGHSLCKLCLTQHAAARTAPRKAATCPLCRTPIESQAVNVALQQLIASMSAKRAALQQAQAQRRRQMAMAAGGGDGIDESLLDAEDGDGDGDGDSSDSVADASRYVQLYEQRSVRCAVLRTKLADLAEESSHTDASLSACGLVVSHLESEERAVEQRLRAVQCELQLVQQHLAAQRDKQAELRERRQRQDETRVGVERILAPLERDRDKAQLIVSRIAPHIQLRDYTTDAHAAAGARSALAPHAQQQVQTHDSSASGGGSSSLRGSSATAAAPAPAASIGASSSSSSSFGSSLRSSASPSPASASPAVAAAVAAKSTTPWPFPAHPTRYYSNA